MGQIRVTMDCCVWACALPKAASQETPMGIQPMSGLRLSTGVGSSCFRQKAPSIL